MTLTCASASDQPGCPVRGCAARSELDSWPYCAAHEHIAYTGVAPADSVAFSNPRPRTDFTWRGRAACRGMSSAIFVPEVETREDTADAVAICATCDVCSECLSEARPGDQGVRGGLTTTERAALRRRRRQEAA